MPTVKHIPGPYRLFFYSFDCAEPAHVHVQQENMVCKFWIEPLMLSYNHGFSSLQLRRIRKTVETYKKSIIEAWYENCGKSIEQDKRKLHNR